MEVLPTPPNRTVLLASADAGLRQRLSASLSDMRWQVCEAQGGAEALAQLEQQPTEALLLDHWLPDLEVLELANQLSSLYPEMDLLHIDGNPFIGSTKSPRRHELLHALREATGAAQRQTSDPQTKVLRREEELSPDESGNSLQVPASPTVYAATPGVGSARRAPSPSIGSQFLMAIDEMVGESPEMLELARMIRLVAPHSATVLIEGETGTGKEIVARALHRLSPRSGKPFVVLNCAAIPESLLEAELFGHTRGAFTGAVQSRTGRIEAAHGGTLFLDEIGEMPIALQAKILRFLENGGLQRVGDNEIVHVDVRVVAATHQQLEKRVAEGSFRLDLYHRLAVFPLEVPPLRDRLGDLAALSEHFLAEMGKTGPRKTLSSDAMAKLRHHDWPGNVRELAHVLERACILTEDSPRIRPEDVRLRRSPRK